MAPASPQDKEFLLSGRERESKRRKVRKGTQSCWECKRRKIRCLFATPDDAACEGCVRRGTRCIGQEFPDAPPPAGDVRRVDDRLGRIEALVEELLLRAGPSSQLNDLLDPQSTLEPQQRGELQVPTSRRPCLKPTVTTPAHFGADLTGHKPEGPHETPLSLNTEKGFPSVPLPKPLGPIQSIASRPTSEITGQHEELNVALLAAWPSKQDLELILSIPVGIAGLLHGVICAPYSSILERNMPSSRDMLQLPPPESHPVLVARILLLLGTYLQCVLPRFAEDLANLSTNPRDMMTYMVNTAIRLVTSNDELVGSIEGIECIMIQSMYENNAGNLRRAWVAMRRAMTLAQLMSLDRGRPPQSIKVLKVETQARIIPEYMWFRLVQSDRYLSMMLGLPHGSVENNFATPEVLQTCSPEESFERMECVAGARILQRNHAAGVDDQVVMTQEIDKLLQQSAALMPPKWWLIPDMTSTGDGPANSTEALRDAIRLTNQLAHYSILLQLHLPYLLSRPWEGRHASNKTTAVYASREILARFVAMRNTGLSTAYCRGVDFVAFIAGTALCLAYIDAGCSHGNGGRSRETFVDVPAHQRLGDRGIMERTRDHLEHMADAGDPIASRIADILRRLLVIEADVAKGDFYSASSCTMEREEGHGCGGKVSDGGKVLQIQIPYYGTIKIERGTVSKSAYKAPDTSVSTEAVLYGLSLLTDKDHTNEVHPMFVQNQETIGSLANRSGNPDWKAASAHLDPPIPPQETVPDLESYSNMLPQGTDGNQQGQHHVLRLNADSDDLLLQGVDTAFFDNLLRGSVVSEELNGDPWMQWMDNEPPQ